MLCLVLFAAGAASAAEFGFGAAYWFPTMHSSMQVNGGGHDGYDFDPVDELDVENQGWPVVNAFYRTGVHEFELVYTAVDYSGRSRLESSQYFSGDLYPAGAEVDFSLDYRSLGMMYGYRFYNRPDVLAGVSLYVIGDLKYYDGSTGLETTGLDHSADFGALFPMFGVDLHLGLVPDTLNARVIMSVEPIGNANAGECVAQIGWTPMPNLEVSGGYRVLLLRIDDDDVRFDHRLNGPYLGATVRF